MPKHVLTFFEKNIFFQPLKIFDFFSTFWNFSSAEKFQILAEKFQKKLKIFRIQIDAKWDFDLLWRKKILQL